MTPSAPSASTASTAPGAACRSACSPTATTARGLNGVATAPLGIFYGGGISQLVAEMIGVGANLLWVFPVALLFFFIVEKTMGNRTPASVEIDGLDIPEMGVLGYVEEDVPAVQNAGQEILGSASMKAKHVSVQEGVTAGKH